MASLLIPQASLGPLAKQSDRIKLLNWPDLVDSEGNGVVSQVCVEGDKGKILFEASQGAGQPLGLGLGENADVGFGLEAELSEPAPEVSGHGVHLQVRLPPEDTPQVWSRLQFLILTFS